MIYNPPSQYQTANTGNVVSGVGDVVSSFGVYGKIAGVALKGVGMVLNANEQSKLEQSQKRIADYNEVYTKKSMDENRMYEAQNERVLQAQKFGDEGTGRVRNFGTDRASGNALIGNPNDMDLMKGNIYNNNMVNNSAINQQEQRGAMTGKLFSSLGSVTGSLSKLIK